MSYICLISNKLVLKNYKNPCAEMVLGRFKYEKSYMHTHPYLPHARYEMS